MLKIFWNLFNKTPEKKDSIESKENNQNKLLELINDTLNWVDWLLYKKSEHWMDSDLCKCDWEKFNELILDLENKWLTIDFAVGKYVIWKTIKDSKSTVHIILKQFKFEEIKKEA